MGNPYKFIPPELTQQQTSIIYASEADVLNMALFGMTAKQWRDKNPDKKGNIRDYASINELICLSNMENINAVLIEDGLSQKERLIKLNKITTVQSCLLHQSTFASYHALIRKQIKIIQEQEQYMEERAIRAEAQRDTAQDKVTKQRQKIYTLETELEEEKGKNLKLTAQLNHDYENSSLPSSMTAERRSRIAARRQGVNRADSRKKQTATEVLQLAPPQEVFDDPDFKKTQKAVVRQAVGIKMLVSVTEYRVDIYRNSILRSQRTISWFWAI